MRTHENDGELAYAKTLLEAHGYTVTHKVMTIQLGYVKQRILEYVQRRGPVSAMQIRDHVWAMDPDAPENPNTVASHICQMNKRLRSEGFQIKSSGGPYATYAVVRIDNPAR